MTTAVELSTVRPWGTARLAPYPTTIARPHASVSIDPDTQLGTFLDHAGHVVEMGKHGTGTGTETTTSTSSDGQSGNDQGSDQGSDTD
ncbi:putative ATP-grasp-modified RiPP [Streptomyces sp. NPDC098077]|uniref:putative ATP-grasp-modified RiPP n=1 Tax=unclassified Streptomyces TaxID=2593676 RepID=UPI001C0D0471|nr:putative ATP-grasp-modified RiPP [Streptomyces sp. YPW6]QWQ42070.1 putative ATP-grasp-modified RiPP [Streptomyces sp. YPW6]